VILKQPKGQSASIKASSTLSLAVNAAPEGTGKTSYQVLPADSAGVGGNALFEAAVPESGVLEMPLSKIPASGSYIVKFTRSFTDGTVISVDSQSFSVAVSDWAEVAGTYEALLEDSSAFGSVDGASYRGFVSLTIGRGGAVTGRFNYNEALQVTGAEEPSVRAYRPVSKTIVGAFSAEGDAPLILGFVPSRKGGGTGGASVEGQVFSAELDFQQSPPALKVTVTDSASSRTNPAATPWMSSAENIPKSLAKSSLLGAAIAGRYIVSSDDSRAYFLVNATPAGSVLWTSRLPGSSGSGSANLSVKDVSNGLVAFYEGRSTTSLGAFNSLSLLGNLNFVPDADGTGWICRFGSSLRPSQLEKQQTRVSKRSNSYFINDVIHNETGIGTVDFSRDTVVGWNNSDPLKGSALFQNLPLKLTLTDPLTDSLGFAAEYSWNLLVTDSGVVRTSVSPDSVSVPPALSLKFDRLNGQLTGGYVPFRGARRSVSLCFSRSPEDVIRQFRGWVESGSLSGVQTGEASVDLSLP